MSKLSQLHKDPLLWIFLVFALYPFLPYFGNFISLGSELLLWFIFTLSFNLCLGQTGLPSFGHGAFYGLGSYAAAITFLRLSDKGFFLPVLGGAVVGCLAAALLGWLIKDKRGVYFAMLTVAFTQVCFGVCWRWDEVTGGEAGLSGIIRQDFLGISMKDPQNFYYFCFVIFAVCSLLIRAISRSCFGLSLQSVRQNHLRSQYLGYPTGLYRFAVYSLSGAFAGLAGALYCLLTQSAFADILDWQKSGDVVMATLLGGGTASFYGPILGSFIFIVCRSLLSSLWEHWLFIYGLSFVIILSFFPTGLMGILQKKKGRSKSS
ncbi:MAG: branched-chain amino acid ABC transporter permease [Deltaproteobacteria bacterium]|jgi:branched-chain amino acid transport system permease protein|nr:branched-chain amino acid ABC transporter permease [Deltaproteobacteria bacterium]